MSSTIEKYIEAISLAMESKNYPQARKLSQSCLKSEGENLDILLLLLEACMAEANEEEALATANKILDFYPDNSASYLKAAQCCLNFGDPAKARKICAKGVRHVPMASLDLWRFYGDLVMELKIFAEALWLWQEVIDKFPEYGYAYNRAAIAALEMEDYDLAEEMHQQGTTLAPGWIEPWFIRADIAMRKKEYFEAAKAWAAVREKFPDDALAFRQGVFCLRKAGANERADALQAEFDAKFEPTPEHLIKYAEIVTAQGDFTEAIKCWNEVRAKYPDHAINNSRLIWAYMEIRDFGRAEALCQEAMQKEPDVIEPYIAFAEIAMRLRIFMDALHRWCLVMEKFPAHGAGYSGAARACIEMGDFERANAICLQGMEAAPAYVDAYKTHAEISMRQRDFSEALKRWGIVKEKFPKLDIGYTSAAWASIELRDYGMADSLCRAAMAKIPHAIGAYITYAETAMRRRDFREALGRWQAVINKFPEHGKGYNGAAFACMEMGDFRQARSFCLKGMERAPRFIDAYEAYAELAMRERDFQEAARRWEVLRKKFPNFGSGYARGAWALIELRDFGGAEALCLEGMNYIPQAIAPHIIYAEAAMRKRDYETAISRWDDLINKFPEHGKGYNGAAFACMELGDFERAEGYCLNGMRDAPLFFDAYLAYAEAAMRKRDFKEALKRWALLREKFPNFIPGYARAAWACIESHDFNQAEILCLTSMANIPQGIDSYIAYAEIAMRQRDWQKALIRWDKLIEKFPQHGKGYNGAAFACMESNDFERAEYYCITGMKRAPNFIDPYIAHAEAAMFQRAYPKALERWAVVREKFPGNGIGYSRAAFALMDLREYDQAEELAQKGMVNAPGFIEPRIIYADIAIRRGKYPLALERWAQARKAFPHHGMGYFGGAWAHKELSEFAEAEALCREGMAKAPYFADAWIMYAEIAMFQRDYSEAVARWAQVIARFPRNGIPYARAAYACMEMREYAKAEKMCQIGRQNAPHFWEPLAAYAEIAMRRKDYKEAALRWREVRRLFTSLPSGYIRGGLACMLLNEYDIAKDLFTKGIQLAPFAYEAQHYLRYIEKLESEDYVNLIDKQENFEKCMERLISEHNLGQNNRLGLIWFSSVVGDCYFFSSVLNYAQKVLKKHIVIITDGKCMLNKFINMQNANNANIEKISVDDKTRKILLNGPWHIREKYKDILDFYWLTYESSLLFNRSMRKDIFANLTRVKPAKCDKDKYISLGIKPGKTVFINTKAHANGNMPDYFWKISIFLFKSLGYKIAINLDDPSKSYGDDIIYLRPPLEELPDFCSLCGLVYGARSGLLEFIAAESNAKMIVFKPEDPIRDIADMYPFIDNSDGRIVEVPLNKRCDVNDPMFKDAADAIKSIIKTRNDNVNILNGMVTSSDELEYIIPELHSQVIWSMTPIPSYHKLFQPKSFDFCYPEYKLYIKEDVIFFEMKIEPALDYEIHIALKDAKTKDMVKNYPFSNNNLAVFQPDEDGEYYAVVQIVHPVTYSSCIFETRPIKYKKGKKAH